MSSTRKSASSNIKTTGDKISKHLEVIIISNTRKSVSSDIQTLGSNTSNTRKSDLSGMRTTTWFMKHEEMFHLMSKHLITDESSVAYSL